MAKKKNSNYATAKREDAKAAREAAEKKQRTGKILAATPMGRFGETEELEGGLLFLLDNKAAGFITGVVLPIDGDFSSYSGV